jgi:hypothetical protein
VALSGGGDAVGGLREPSKSRSANSETKLEFERISAARSARRDDRRCDLGREIAKMNVDERLFSFFTASKRIKKCKARSN